MVCHEFRMVKTHWYMVPTYISVCKVLSFSCMVWTLKGKPEEGENTQLYPENGRVYVVITHLNKWAK